VDKEKFVIERIIKVNHVDTSFYLLKQLLSHFSLYMSSVCQACEDKVILNMQGEFNDLKSLILKENESASYVHYFAHRLQLTLVAVVENHKKICSFFNLVITLSNVVRGSCKRRDILREKQFEKVVKRIFQGEIMIGRGMNQERALKRPRKTRWSSQFDTLVNLIYLFSFVIDVLEVIAEDRALSKHKAQATDLLDAIQYFNSQSTCT